MSLELFIALCYLKAKRKGLFAVVTTSIGAQAHVTVYGAGSAAELARSASASSAPRCC